jgi:hypothetical protein
MALAAGATAMVPDFAFTHRSLAAGFRWRALRRAQASAKRPLGDADVVWPARATAGARRNTDSLAAATEVFHLTGLKIEICREPC